MSDRRWLGLALLLLACEPSGPHWLRVCTQAVTVMEPQATGMKGQPFIWVPRTHCLAWDSVWVDSTSHADTAP